MRLSCADFAFPLINHDAALDLIAAIGFEGVDIGLFADRSHLQPIDQFQNIPFRAAELRKRAEDRGLVVSDVFLQSNLDFSRYAVNHPDAGRRGYAREQFLKCVEYASITESEHISGLPGITFDSESFEQSFERCIEENTWRVNEAKKANLKYGVEAHIESIIEEPDMAMRLMEAVPELGLTLDYSHFVRQGKPDTAGDILIPYANHMHARGAAKGILQSSVEENEIDFVRVVKLLKNHQYAKWICLEYCWTPHWENCSRNDNLSETVILRDVLLQALNS